MYDFYVNTGKDHAHQQIGNDYNHLQKTAQVIAKLCEHLLANTHHKSYFDNWFTALDLLIYLTRKGILACEIIQAKQNRLQGSLQSTKNLAKVGHELSICNCIVIVKWYDNNAVHIASNYVDIEPMAEVERLCKNAKLCLNVVCYQLINAYNGVMGGAEFADMLKA